jgi:hypothetical protein
MNTVEAFQALSKKYDREVARKKVSEYTEESQNPSTRWAESGFYRTTRDNPLFRAAFPFLGQPVVMANYLHGAWIDYQWAKHTKSKKEIAKARRALGIRIGASAMSAATSVGIVALVAALRNRNEPPDDEEKKTRKQLRYLVSGLQEIADYAVPGLGRISDLIPVKVPIDSDGNVTFRDENGEVNPSRYIDWMSIGQNQSIVAQTMENVLRGAADMAKGDDDGRLERGAIKALRAAGNLFGVPIDALSIYPEIILGERLTTPETWTGENRRRLFPEPRR